MSSQGPLQGHIYYNSDGPLQGGVVYADKGSLFSRILHGVAGVLKDIGGAVIDHAPDILQGVATGLAAASFNHSGNITPDYNRSSDAGLWQAQNNPVFKPNIPTFQARNIPQFKPSTLGRDALRQVDNRWQAHHAPRYSAPANPLAGLTRQSLQNSLQQPKQWNNPTSYTTIPNRYSQSNEVFLHALDPGFGRSAPAPIQEDWTQIQGNLAHAQKPVTYQQQLQQEQARQLAELQRQNQQAQLRLAEEQAQLVQQQQRLINTRPLDENSALQQMMMRSNEARDQPAKSIPQKQSSTTHDKAYLNRRQEVLNQLFGGQVFDRRDKQFPYGLQDSQKVDDRNIAQMAAVSGWILFGQSTNGQWSDHKVDLLERQLLSNGRNWILPEVKRQLEIARKLNDILKRNEEIDFQRNDAKAFAEGMKVLIDANTRNGKVDTAQLISDIQLFTIDAGEYEAGRLLGQAKESNAAYNLMAGPRLGTIGWKEKYWDWGKQLNDKGKLANQAHHFTFFFTKGLLAGSDAAVWVKHRGAEAIDPIGNKQDQDLGKLATDLGWKIRTGKIQWKEIPQIIYQELKD